jgi:hypothetical protein
MSELRLVGLHDDGEHVVLVGPDGQRFRLPIDEALRAAVRRDRPHLEQVRAEAGAHLPPREIQARIRAGATAQEVADEAGVPVEIVRRYEGPVLAERDFVAGQARSTRIGHDISAPTLGDLATDRLATRGVSPGTVTWDASRDAVGPWRVELGFEIGGQRRTARWSFDVTARTLRATDDEARWLSETEISDSPISRRHLSAVRPAVFDVDVDAALRPVLAAVDLPAPEPAGGRSDQEPDPFDATAALLDDLAGRRGVRQPLVEDEDEELDEFEGFGPQRAFDFDKPGQTVEAPEPPAAHPPASRPHEAVDATVLSLPRRAAERPGAAADADLVAAEPTDPPTGPTEGVDATTRPRSRKGRASVPSWDEIVFGAKPE